MNEKEFLKRYDEKDQFTENEIESILWDFLQFDEINGNDHRWYRPVMTIIKVNDRFFAIDWNRGLTEYQEHEYPNQPYEVESRKKIIEVTEWVKK